MNFKEWLFSEQSQILRDFLPTHQVIHLGKIGLWQVYSALEGSTSPRVLTIDEYKAGPKYKTDYFVERLGDVKMHCENAAHALQKIGFPKYSTNMIFADLRNRRNYITGGGVGGYASVGNWTAGSKHGFVVDRNDINERTIVHEHAHMWWDNILSKEAKEKFKRWYEKNVGNWIKKPENYASYAQENKLDELKQKMLSAAKDHSRIFIEELETALDRKLENYFKMQNAENESEFIEASLWLPGRWLPGRLKKEITLSSSISYRDINLKAGEIIGVECVWGGYILNHRDGDRYESKVIKRDKIFEFVEFDEELLETELKFNSKSELLKKFKKIKKPSQYFAPKSDEDKINKAFEEAMQSIFDNYLGSTQFEYSNRMFMGNPYNTFVSMLSKRFKAGKIKSTEDIGSIFEDMVKKVYLKDLNVKELGYDVYDMQIDKPEGNALRDLIQRKGVVPTSYAAANYDELWAELVTLSIFQPHTVSKELKTILYQILTNTYHEDSPGVSIIHRPRRLVSRKRSKN
jgi:hypothetical protein